MGCQKELDFAVPPATGAHLSYYWTMDEAADLNKIDSAAAKSWTATTGNLSPPAKFSNGIQIDNVFVGGAPFFHGLQNLADADFGFNAATSTGVSVCFWFNKTVDQTALPLTLFEFSIECYDPGFTVDAELIISGDFRPASVINNLQIRHADFSGGPDTSFLTTFLPVTGTWYMIAVTVDLASQTLNLYINGALVTSVPDPGLFHTSPQGDLVLKCSFGTAGNTLVVLVDELLLSLKGALSPAQIVSLYNTGTGVTWPNITPIVPFP